MTTSTPSGRLNNHSISNLLKPLTIYRNDHRNNPAFLAKNPNTIVIDKSAPKNVKKPHEQHPAARHHPRTTTRPNHPHVQGHLPSHQHAASPQSVATHNPDDEELENPDLTDADADDNNSPDAETNSFNFHELTGESYDPTADLLSNPRQDRGPLRDGVSPTPPVEVVHPTDLYVNPSTFSLKTDAQDGSARFKATLTFDGDMNLSDYDVIVTRVTT